MNLKYDAVLYSTCGNTRLRHILLTTRKIQLKGFNKYIKTTHFQINILKTNQSYFEFYIIGLSYFL